VYFPFYKMNIIKTAGFRYREFAVISRCLYDYLPFGTGLNGILRTAGRGMELDLGWGKNWTRDRSVSTRTWVRLKNTYRR
jgi:hypothetical protein